MTLCISNDLKLVLRKYWKYLKAVEQVASTLKEVEESAY